MTYRFVVSWDDDSIGWGERRKHEAYPMEQMGTAIDRYIVLRLRERAHGGVSDVTLCMEKPDDEPQAPDRS